MTRAVEGATQTFVWAFERSFAVPTLRNLTDSLRRRDDTAFRAAVAMATYLEWLASAGEDSSAAPDLSPYKPRRVKDAEGFAEAYESYVRWMAPTDREDQLNRQRDQLSGAATRMLDIGELERQTTRKGGKFSALRYEDRYQRQEGRWRFADRLLSFMYYVPVDEYAEALGALDRMRAYDSPRAADFPEQSTSWQDYARRFGRR